MGWDFIFGVIVGVLGAMTVYSHMQAEATHREFMKKANKMKAEMLKRREE